MLNLRKTRVMFVAGMIAATMVISVGAEAKPVPSFTATAVAETCGADVAFSTSWDKARISFVAIAIVDTDGGDVVGAASHRLTKATRRGGVDGAVTDLALALDGTYELRATFMIKRGKRDVLVEQMSSPFDVECLEV